MVQKDVGERLAAAPGSRSYGVPSVLCQLACEVGVLRQISRSVFFPVPNVDSVLIGMRRVAPAPPPELRRFVQGAFAHRRKAMARSLMLSIGTDRERLRAALVQMGRPPDERAERLAPAALAALWEAVR
jgi:16S rRNA (adenine1518-N6/adenine1519-N6)-dimethyltransferase